MLKKLFIIIIYILIISSLCSEVNQKKPLDHSVYEKWNRLENQQISNDGEWVSYEINPARRDGKLFVINSKTTEVDSVCRGYDARFSASSDFLACKITPKFKTIRALKLDDTKDDELPQDTLGIYSLNSDSLTKFPKVKNYQIAKDSSDWVAFLSSTSIQSSNSSDSIKTDSLNNTRERNETENLFIYNPQTNEDYRFANVTEYDMSDSGKLIGFISNIEDSIDTTLVCAFETDTGKIDTLFFEAGSARKIRTDHSGAQVAFLSSKDTTKVKTFSLIYWKQNTGAMAIADTLTAELPADWTVSEHGDIFFSENDEHLFFGVSEKPWVEEPDTLLEDEKFNVDIWNWKDPYIQSYQKEHLKREQNRSFLAVYHIAENKLIRIEDPQIRYSSLNREGNCKYAIGYADLPYAHLSQWFSHSFRDFYLIDLESGKKSLIAERSINYYRLSPDNKYIFWYDKGKQDWFATEISSDTTNNLTQQISANFFNEENDRPRKAYSYGFAGWTENDKYFLVYDNFDIWKIDPKMQDAPHDLTNSFGRKNKIRFRLVDLDKEKNYLDKDLILLRGFDEKTKASGFYSIDFRNKKNPQELIKGNYYFYYPTKARKSDSLIWRKMSFEEYPELHISNLKFGNIRKLSETNPQKANYLWGTSELVKWKDSSGQDFQGVLYKPENFDPTKKYPMIVKIYETGSDRVNSHYSPRPSTCIINYTFYTSNGYIVWRPDIHYESGRPGESALEAVLSGVDHILEKGFVDKDNLGLIGHSWGGYESAYIITQTDKFAAAMAGAPVSNMTSAYGGIRWGSGKSRQGQYEKGQSRIGSSLWQDRELYLENSPLFYADQVTTPLLILHNDNDGAVPREQGIELFLALKRLQKPVWMLDYNNEKHLVRKWGNRVDLSKRLFQFFNHFLKGYPAPVWLEKGIPAIQKGKIDGYDVK